MAINGLGVVSGTFATQTYANNAGGLQLVTPTSIANSGGSSSASGGAVTFTGVNSISLNGIFNATYDNYLVQIVLSSMASGANLRQRYRVGGVDASGASEYAWGYRYLDSGASGWEAGSTADSAISVSTTGIAAILRAAVTVYLPAQAVQTASISDAWSLNTLTIKRDGIGRHSAATAYDGITFFPTSSTISGTIRAYGYKNS